tara:strand:+ start:610 stop:798 length:189 start_codon:yes stop_codon:yes gene_type:complete
MNIKLTNGKKTIVRSKIQYEANINHFTLRGFKPLNETKEKTDKVVELKPKKRKHAKKTKKKD